MALPNPAPGDSIAANDIDEVRLHLTGTAGKTEAWHLRQSSGNALVTLATADGSNGFRINDSAGTQVFYVDSDGNVSQIGTFTPSALTLPVSASPSQTTDGQIIWDSDDDVITVGTGATTRRFYSAGTSYNPFPTLVRKSTDESITNDNTLSNDSELTATVVANATYIVRGCLHVDTNATPGFKMAFTTPASSTISIPMWAATGGTLGGASVQVTSGTPTLAVTTGFNADVVVSFDGTVETTNAGSITLQWAQNTSDANTTSVKEGSYIEVLRVS